MKIVFAVGAYWPSTGGVQMVTQYLAEGLAHRNNKVIIITKLFGNSPSKEIHNGVIIKRIVEKDLFKFHYGEKKKYQNIILEETENASALIVVCSNNFVAQWVYPIICDIKCKKIMYQHGMYDGRIHFDQIHSILRFFKHIFLTVWWEIYHRRYWDKIMQFDACIHLFKNDTSYCYFEKNGFLKNYVNTNGCENVFFQKEVEDSTVNKYGLKRPYFLCVANFCPGKNQLLALKLFKEAHCTLTDITFIGSDRNKYSELLEKEIHKDVDLKDKVHILYGIPRQDVVSLTKNSLACIMTSENEFLPITILEAIACGKPFISTDVGVVNKIPGGNVCNRKGDISFWMKYYEENHDYVRAMGAIAKEYAKNSCQLAEKITQLENIIRA